MRIREKSTDVLVRNAFGARLAKVITFSVFAASACGGSDLCHLDSDCKGSRICGATGRCEAPAQEVPAQEVPAQQAPAREGEPAEAQSPNVPATTSSQVPAVDPFRDHCAAEKSPSGSRSLTIQRVSFDRGEYQRGDSGVLEIVASEADLGTGGDACWTLRSESAASDSGGCSALNRVGRDLYRAPFRVGAFLPSGRHSLASLTVSADSGEAWVSLDEDAERALYDDELVVPWLRVVGHGPTDTSPPTVVSARFHRSTYRQGDAGVLDIVLHDDASGVDAESLTGVTIRSESGNTFLPVPSQEFLREGRFRVTFSVGTFAETGAYFLSRVNVRDIADNSGYAVDVVGLAAMTVEGSGPSDVAPPVVRSIMFDKPTYAPGEEGYVELIVTDDVSGVDHSYWCWSIEGGTSYWQMGWCGSLTAVDHERYRAAFRVDPCADAGAFFLRSGLALTDVAGNRLDLYASSEDLHYRGTQLPVPRASVVRVEP